MITPTSPFSIPLPDPSHEQISIQIRLGKVTDYGKRSIPKPAKIHQSTRTKKKTALDIDTALHA
jgi:hypothetical protein